MLFTQKDLGLQSVLASSERYFRMYHKFNTEPDLDTLFNLLNAMHSLNDILNNRLNDNFFQDDEFISLKAIRNLFHHQNDVINELKIIPKEMVPQITTDLIYLCLISRHLVEESYEHIQNKFKDLHIQIIKKTFKWYGNVVNINPAIFNFSVKVYEKLKSLNIVLTSEEYILFDTAYKYEIENNFPHFITGEIYFHTQEAERVLNDIFE